MEADFSAAAAGRLLAADGGGGQHTAASPACAHTHTWSLGTRASVRSPPGRLTYEPADARVAEDSAAGWSAAAAAPGCKGQSRTVVEVWARVVADFALSSTAGCDPLGDGRECTQSA